MSTLVIPANSMFTIDVTARKSDEYSDAAYLKFERKYNPDSPQRCNEMFLTTTQMDQLGRFLVRQAEEIRMNNVVKGHLTKG
jgi:hypothetical protein